MHHHTDRITHTTAFVTPVMEHWLEREIQVAREETRYRHMGYSFRLAARVLLYADRITHTTVFVTPVVKPWLEREIAQWVHHEGSIRRPIASWANALTTELHLALVTQRVVHACLVRQPAVKQYDLELAMCCRRPILSGTGRCSSSVTRMPCRHCRPSSASLGPSATSARSKLSWITYTKYSHNP